MGDGQHIWAAADWQMMMRALFLREEGEDLILGPGLRPEWLSEPGASLHFGPTLTRFGELSVTARTLADGDVELSWQGELRTPPRHLQVQLFGLPPQHVDDPAVGRHVLSVGAATLSGP
jgi:hypothetical protein